MNETVSATAGNAVVPPRFQLDTGPDLEDTSELDQDAFLQLLIAQLKHQDPLEPSSSEDFIATTAQFTVVEKLEEIAKQGEDAAAISALSTANSFLGQEITALVDGARTTATVHRSQLVGGSVSLITDKGPIAIESVVEIGPGSTAAAAAAGQTNTSSTTNTSTTSPSNTTASVAGENQPADARTATGDNA
ncbi:MAG: flagellar hook capping FlgD N-terminal domain-containing protein [Actinomycetota bacterium]